MDGFQIAIWVIVVVFLVITAAVTMPLWGGFLSIILGVLATL